MTGHQVVQLTPTGYTLQYVFTLLPSLPFPPLPLSPFSLPSLLSLLSLTESLDPAERDAALTMCMISGSPDSMTNVTPGKPLRISRQESSVCMCYIS